MGISNQRRLIRKIDLEMFLSQIGPVSFPKAFLEQYLISEKVAATMLYTAYCSGDIAGSDVLDLGCGTGRLSLGAGFLGAGTVFGIDIDTEAIREAYINGARTGLNTRTQWINADVRVIRGLFRTVIQNPPFGVQKRNADRIFLEKALEIGQTVYSLHNHPTFDSALLKRLRNTPSNVLQVQPSSFLKEFVEDRGGSINSVLAMPMLLPKCFDFHQKVKHEIIVDCYIIDTRHKIDSS